MNNQLERWLFQFRKVSSMHTYLFSLAFLGVGGPYSIGKLLTNFPINGYLSCAKLDAVVVTTTDVCFMSFNMRIL